MSYIDRKPIAGLLRALYPPFSVDNQECLQSAHDMHSEEMTLRHEQGWLKGQ